MSQTTRINATKLSKWCVGVILCVLSLTLLGCSKAYNTSQKRGDIIVYLDVSAVCPKPGETLYTRATVKNWGSQTYRVDLTDQPVFDLSIGFRGEPGKNVVKWSGNKPLTSDLTHIELKPGESRTIELNWVVENTDFGVVTASFIEGQRWINDPIRADAQLYIFSCPGPWP